MAIIVKLISDYAPWVYAACALVALWYLRVAVQARQERRQAAFSLEREAALNKTYQALNIGVFLLVMIGIVYFISHNLAAAVQPLVDAVVSPTPTALTLPTLTPTPEPATATPTPSPVPTRKPTPRPTPTVLLSPTTPPIVAPRCPDSRARLLRPGVNEIVSGAVQIVGSAEAERFDYYKLEFKPSGAAGDPTFIVSSRQPVPSGVLGSWNVAGLAPGAYTLYLRTVDVTGNFGECSVQVQVNRP